MARLVLNTLPSQPPHRRLLRGFRRAVTENSRNQHAAAKKRSSFFYLRGEIITVGCEGVVVPVVIGLPFSPRSLCDSHRRRGPAKLLMMSQAQVPGLLVLLAVTVAASNRAYCRRRGRCKNNFAERAQ